MPRLKPRRKCRHCGKFFIPDPRTADRQRYCFEPPCRQASQAASQQKWLRKEGNGDYFRGPEAVGRVQAWRKAHPGYWRKSSKSRSTQAVADQPVNSVQSSCNAPPSPLRTLQDDCLAQDPAFVGLISMVTGSTLQEEIAATTRQLLLRGRNILGIVRPENGPNYDDQTCLAASTAAPNAAELQLGGPPIGPP